MKTLPDREKGPCSRWKKLFFFGLFGAALLAGGMFHFAGQLLPEGWADPGATPPLALWVWNAQMATDSKAREKLLSFSGRHRVNSLYLSAYHLTSPLDHFYREFNRKAHRLGIKVYALAGDPRWGLTRYHHLPLAWVEEVIQFNASASPAERFDGIHTDVEVYLLSKSWAERPAELLGGYLDLNVKIAEALQGEEEPPSFGVDIPFWFDDDPTYRIVWHGAAKAPSQHVLDTVDEVTVLAYRNFSEGTDGTIRLVSLEMDYADRIGKRVVIGQETQEELQPPYITFGGTSCAALRKELKKILLAVGSRPSFGGFAIHHYESYRKLCSD